MQAKLPVFFQQIIIASFTLHSGGELAPNHMNEVIFQQLNTKLENRWNKETT